MSWEHDIQAAFENLKKREVSCFIATVLEVDKANGICTVKDEDLEYTDVRLSAIINGNDQKHYVFPAKGSTVLVEPINEDLQQLYVSKYSQVESMTGKIGTTQWLIDANGYKIQRNDENLKVVLNDYMDKFGELCDQLSAVVVAIGVTPNVPAITLIKNQVATVIKPRLNIILQD
ncbi:MAG: hypothetical protein WA775_03060 [Psychroserpens sp.]|uniref:hypothetical protein n=1 Tax=Psychroserpens sp. TaxID=2020870 RepID=UPI003C8EDE93